MGRDATRRDRGPPVRADGISVGLTPCDTAFDPPYAEGRRMDIRRVALIFDDRAAARDDRRLLPPRSGQAGRGRAFPAR